MRLPHYSRSTVLRDTGLESNSTFLKARSVLPNEGLACDRSSLDHETCWWSRSFGGFVPMVLHCRAVNTLMKHGNRATVSSHVVRRMQDRAVGVCVENTFHSSRTPIIQPMLSPPRLLKQNDGTVDGHRYFLCHPNRGLFVRITRCRTRAGYSVGDERHVSCPWRTLGKKVGDEGRNTKLSSRNTPHTAAAHNAKDRSAPPYLSENFRWDNTSLISGNIRQPCRERSRVDSRLNGIKWVPIENAETRRQWSRRYEVGARRHDIQLESDSSESSSSGSASSGSDRSQVKSICGVSRSC